MGREFGEGRREGEGEVGDEVGRHIGGKETWAGLFAAA